MCTCILLGPLRGALRGFDSRFEDAGESQLKPGAPVPAVDLGAVSHRADDRQTETGLRRTGGRHYPGAIVRYLDEKLIRTFDLGSHRDHAVLAAHESVHDRIADRLGNRELDVTAIRPPASAYSPTLLRASVTLPGWLRVLNSSGGRSRLESSVVIQLARSRP